MGKGPIFAAQDEIDRLSMEMKEVEVITADRTLTADDSGKTFLLGIASGATLTLPTAADGLNFDFMVVTTITSNNYGIDTAATDELFKGTVVIHDKDNNAYDAKFAADESDDDSIDLNTGTTGGLAGGWLSLVSYGGHWYVCGYLIGDGTLATPFS